MMRTNKTRNRIDIWLEEEMNIENSDQEPGIYELLEIPFPNKLAFLIEKYPDHRYYWSLYQLMNHGARLSDRQIREISIVGPDTSERST